MSTNYISQITASNGTTYDIQEGVTTRIFRATCVTPTETAAKVATLDDATGYSLAEGVQVAVRFMYGNSADTPTLNVNSGGAKTIVIPTTTISTNYSSDKSYTSWGRYETIIFTYNGTYWITSGSSYILYKAASIKTSLSDYTNGSNVSFRIPFTNLSGSNYTLTSAYVSPNFTIVDSQINHLATLNLGNSLGSDETTYRRGALRLYSQTGNYVELETKDTLSTNGTIYFPDYINNNATIATTEDIPSITLNGNSTTSPSFYAPTSAGTNGYYLKSGGSNTAPSWASFPTIPSITLNGSSNTSPSFYAPTGAGTSGQYLKSNGSGAPSWTNFPTIPTITLNGSASTSPSFYAPTSAGTSGQYLKSNGSGAPSWSSISDSDENVKSTLVTTGGTYYIVGSSNSSTNTSTLNKHDSVSFFVTANTSAGDARLILGNSTASGTNSKKGLVRLYGSNAYYTDIISGVPSENRTITLPDATGTIALISDIPVSDVTVGGTSVVTNGVAAIANPVQIVRW